MTSTQGLLEFTDTSIADQYQDTCRGPVQGL